MHNSVWISLPFPADQQQKQTEIAICSQNCVWNLEFAIDFWCLQLTFDVFNWVYSKHMIHYNKVNWKNFAKYFLKFFPIDFQYPIDFSQLHMIRPLILTLIQGNRMHGTAMQYVYVCLIQFIKFMNEEESERPPYFISTISIRLRRHSKTTFNIRLIFEHLVFKISSRLNFSSKSKQPLLLLLYKIVFIVSRGQVLM